MMASCQVICGTGTASRKARQHDGNKLLPTTRRKGIRAGGYKNSVNFDGKNAGNEKQRGHSRRHNGFNDRRDEMVALELSRNAILIELNPEYAEMARRRCSIITPGLPL